MQPDAQNRREDGRLRQEETAARRLTVRYFESRSAAASPTFSTISTAF